MAYATIQLRAQHDEDLTVRVIRGQGDNESDYLRIDESPSEAVSVSFAYPKGDPQRLTDVLLDAIEAITGERPLFHEEIEHETALEIVRSAAR